MSTVARTARTTVLMTVATILSLWVPTACRPIPTAVPQVPSTPSAVTPSRIPVHVKRVAVWYPRTSERDVAYGYLRLEQAAFQLKQQRGWLTIVERRHMGSITDELRFQVTGRVSDDSAVPVGKWLGADSLMVFHIDGPTWRERLLARIHEQMPPVVVSSKIISVETAEVFYHDIVRVQPATPSGSWGDSMSDAKLQSLMRTALDQALSVSIAHLAESFR